MRIKFFDEYSNVICDFELGSIEELGPEDYVKDFKQRNSKEMVLFEEFPLYEITSYLPYNDGENFYVESINKKASLDSGYHYKDIKGTFISSLFYRHDKDNVILNLVREIYKTGKGRHLKAETSENNIILRFLDIRFIKYDDSIVVLSNDISNLTFTSLEEEKLFENEINPKAIIQDGKIVRANKYYLELINQTNVEAIGREFLKNIEILNGADLNHWNDIYYKLLNKEIYYFTDTVNIISKGKNLWIDVYATVTTFAAKPAVLIILTDITEQELNKQKLEEITKEAVILSENLQRIQTTTKTSLCFSHDRKHCKVTPELFNILEKDMDLNNIVDEFTSRIIDFDGDPKKYIEEQISPQSPDLVTVFKIKTYKDNIKYIKNSVHHDFDSDGNLLRCICSKQDITKEVEYANQLEIALDEKEILLKEVHHRVKNNLQIILSLINLNKRFKDNPISIINDTQNRINAMALIHEKIYGSNSLAAVNIKDYIESIVESLFVLYNSDIAFHSNLEPIELNMDESIPLGLILNELINNTIKYAFPNEPGNLFIDLKKEGSKITLIYRDDGVGLPDDFDFENINSLGMVVVKNLTEQIDGEINILDVEGTGYSLIFKYKP